MHIEPYYNASPASGDNFAVTFSDITVAVAGSPSTSCVGLNSILLRNVTTSHVSPTVNVSIP